MEKIKTYILPNPSIDVTVYGLLNTTSGVSDQGKGLHGKTLEGGAAGARARVFVLLTVAFSERVLLWFGYEVPLKAQETLLE